MRLAANTDHVEAKLTEIRDRLGVEFTLRREDSGDFGVVPSIPHKDFPAADFEWICSHLPEITAILGGKPTMAINRMIEINARRRREWLDQRLVEEGAPPPPFIRVKTPPPTAGELQEIADRID